jgi:hypothetical protein
VAGVAEIDPKQPFALARLYQLHTFPRGDRKTVNLDWSAICPWGTDGVKYRRRY